MCSGCYEDDQTLSEVRVRRAIDYPTPATTTVNSPRGFSKRSIASDSVPRKISSCSLVISRPDDRLAIPQHLS